MLSQDRQRPPIASTVYAQCQVRPSGTSIPRRRTAAYQSRKLASLQEAGTLTATRTTDQLRLPQHVRLHPRSKALVLGAMVATLVSLLIWTQIIVPAWNALSNQWHYGDSQITQMDADVGHGGVSHFLAEYYHHQIMVIEFPAGGALQPHVYISKTSSLDTVSVHKVSLLVQTVNPHGQAGKPDLVVQIDDQQSGVMPVLYNNGETFQTDVPQEKK